MEMTHCADRIQQHALFGLKGKLIVRRRCNIFTTVTVICILLWVFLYKHVLFSPVTLHRQGNCKPGSDTCQLQRFPGSIKKYLPTTSLTNVSEVPLISTTKTNLSTIATNKSIEAITKISQSNSTPFTKDSSNPSKNSSGPPGKSPWYVQSTVNYTIFIHSVFYDDRKGGGKVPSVRILAISDLEKTVHLYCDIWYNGKKPYSTNATKLEGHIHKINNRIYQHVKSRGIFKEYMVSCKLPSSKTKPPSQVSLRTAANINQSDMRIPVTVPEKPETKMQTGVCVAISYGQIDFALFVEWVELNKVFGVKEFNVYFAYMTGNMNTLFDYYKTTGEVRYHYMPPIIPVPSDVAVAKPYVRLNSLPSVNHCLLTNMHRYTTIALIDYDELIVPRNHMDYLELLRVLNTKYGYGDNWASYTFRNVYFFIDVPPDESQPKYLPKLRYRKKSKPTPYLKYPKSFINPQRCMVTGNHYCIKAFSGVGWSRLKPDVSTEVATSHHYRQCPFYLNCTDYKSSLTQDDILLQYKQQLIEKTKPVLAKLQYFS